MLKKFWGDFRKFLSELENHEDILKKCENCLLSTKSVKCLGKFQKNLNYGL